MMDIPEALDKEARRKERLDIAKLAMQGILANNAAEDIGWKDWDKNLAHNSIKAADALLKEIDK